VCCGCNFVFLKLGGSYTFGYVLPQATFRSKFPTHIIFYVVTFLILFLLKIGDRFGGGTCLVIFVGLASSKLASGFYK
jgi:hypothetical protein